MILNTMHCRFLKGYFSRTNAILRLCIPRLANTFVSLPTTWLLCRVTSVRDVTPHTTWRHTTWLLCRYWGGQVYMTSDWHCSVPSVSASSTLLDNIRLSPQTCTILTYLGWQSDRTVQFNPVSARTCSTFLGDFRGTSEALLWITLWYRVHIQLLLLFCGSLFRLSKPT